jgi:hypothetical protein
MTDLLLGFLGTASALVFWELVKRVGVRLVEGYAPIGLAHAMQTLDRILPDLVADGASVEDVEQSLRKELGSLTGSEWSEICGRFDLRVFLARAPGRDTLATSTAETRP